MAARRDEGRATQSKAARVMVALVRWYMSPPGHQRGRLKESPAFTLRF